jgi:hypothetical protein
VRFLSPNLKPSEQHAPMVFSILCLETEARVGDGDFVWKVPSAEGVCVIPGRRGVICSNRIKRAMALALRKML